MTEILLLVIAVAVVYIACKLPKDPARKKEEEQVASRKEPMIAQRLPQLKGRLCEFTMKNLTTFNSGMTGKATVVDVDDEWVLLSVTERKGAVTKAVRIASIDDVKELA